MRYIIFALVILVSFFLPTTVMAGNPSNEVRVGRYASVTPSATPEQSNLLAVVINISFGSNITTVGEALKHLVVRSGFSLADLHASDPYLPILLSRPLPQVHRHLGPITLSDALTTLAGPAWYLSVDPVNRLISYELLSKFRPVDASTPNSEH